MTFALAFGQFLNICTIVHCPHCRASYDVQFEDEDKESGGILKICILLTWGIFLRLWILNCETVWWHIVSKRTLYNSVRIEVYSTQKQEFIFVLVFNDTSVLQPMTSGWAMKNFHTWPVGHENGLFLSGWATKFFEKISIFPQAHPSRYFMTGP